MRFTWKAIILAPLPVPLIASVVMAIAPSQDPLFSWLFFLGGLATAVLYWLLSKPQVEKQWEASGSKASCKPEVQ